MGAFRRVGIVLALTLWAQACMVYRAPPSDPALLRGREVRVRSQTPFSVTAGAGGTAVQRSVTTVEGKVTRVAGDTLVMERMASTAVDGSYTRFRRQQEIVTLTLEPGSEVTVHELHRGRTALLVIGVPAVVVGVLALLVSQMEFPGLLTPDVQSPTGQVPR